MPIIGGLPNDIQNGDDLDADLVMEDFDWIVSETNANAAASGANTDITSLGGLTTPISVPQGGTGGTTVQTARVSLGIDVLTNVGDAAYSILPTDKVVTTSVAFTAARTWTLPAANAVNPGQSFVVMDKIGTITSTNTLTVQRSGSDTINGGTSIALAAAYQMFIFISDGVSRWTSTELASALPLALALGGTGQTSALTARGSGGLNVESGTATGDTAYTILETDRYVYTSAALTASRTWTLPAANAVNAGGIIIVDDAAGGVTSVNTLIVARAGSDTINGGTSFTLSFARARAIFISNGSNAWSAVYVPLAATKAEMEAAATAVAFTSPGQQKNHPLHPKRDCYATLGAAASGTIVSGTGITSISRSAAGRYSVVMTALSDANWRAHVQPETDGTAIQRQINIKNSSRATTGFDFVVVDGGGGFSDVDAVSITVWGTEP